MTFQNTQSRILAAAVVVVILTAVFLAGPARDAMNAATALAVLIHLGLGAIVIIPVVWAIARATRAASSLASRLLFLFLLFAFSLCAAGGLYLAASAATGHSTARDQFTNNLHYATGLASVLLAAICLGPSLRSWRKRNAGQEGEESIPVGDEARGTQGVPEVLGSRRQNRPGAPGLRGHHAESAKAGCPWAILPSPGEPVRTTPPAITSPSHPLTPSPPHPLVASAALLLVLTQGALFGAAAILPSYNAEEYYRDLTATTPGQARNSLFPAGLRTETAHALAGMQSGDLPIPDSASCGIDGCHPSEHREWQGSAHRFAGTDPFYLAARNESVRTTGPDTARWCQGCHAPGAAIAGSGHPGGSKQSNAGEADGVGCFACHAATGTPTRTGNGRFVLAEPQDYPFAGERGRRRGLHDFLLRVRPGPHQRAFLKPELHRSAEFCGSCHRQSMTAAQNHYQFVRGIDEYGEWARGPASGRNARSDGAVRAQTCQECHFHDTSTGFGAGRVSHSASGANTALAALMQRDTTQEDLVKRMRSGVSVDLFSLRRAGSPVRAETLIAPIERPVAPYTLRPGERYWLDVVVRNRGGGHDFPAGYPDLTDAWLELMVTDAAGGTLFSNGVQADQRPKYNTTEHNGTPPRAWSGSAPVDASQIGVAADPMGNVPAGAHRYGALGLDRTGAPILRHNITEQITTAYRRTIPAGGADIARFRLVIPASSGTASTNPPHRRMARAELNGGDRLGQNARPAGHALRLTVRLRYRSVRPEYARWALSGAAAKDFEPPVIDLAEATVLLPLQRIAEAPTGDDRELTRSIAERFEAYGTGLLAPREKPDIGGAVAAFGVASRLTPERPEPWLGLGRAYLREPDLRLAAGNFERALVTAPGSPAAIAELSVVYNKQGQPERAIQALTPLVARFPQDAALRFDLGLGLFRAGRYADATESFRRALAIDPDQYAAHFQLKRCYEVLQRVPEARTEDSITRTMSEDRAAARLVPPYLAKHPNAAQPFPVHELR